MRVPNIGSKSSNKSKKNNNPKVANSYRPNEPLYIFLVFVMVVNMLAQLTNPNSVMAGYTSPPAPSSITTASTTNDDNEDKEGLAAKEKANANTPEQTKAKQAFGNLPLSFELNSGQTDDQVKYLARGQGYGIFLTDKASAVLSLHKVSGQGVVELPSSSASCADLALGENSSNGAAATTKAGDKDNQVKECPTDAKSQATAGDTSGVALSLELVGGAANGSKEDGKATTLQVEGQEELVGKSNYLLGNDPKGWRTGLTNYGRIVYKGVYPGIDIAYYGTNSRELEYDFVVAPGTDPNQISFRFGGAEEVTLTPDGELLIKFAGDSSATGGEAANVQVKQLAPKLYQKGRNGVTKSVIGRYVQKEKEGKNTFGFLLGEYDKTQPLVLDPVLSYSTYLGGSASDIGTSITVDNSTGNAYLVGRTTTSDFPITPTAVYTSFGTAGGYDIWVAKLDSTGTNLLYSTYLGGTNADYATGIAYESSTGYVYVAGRTQSSDFPTTSGGYDTTFANNDGFIFKLDTTMTGTAALLYSSYVGGSSGDDVTAIALDPANTGRVYLTGLTSSSNFPTVAGSYDTILGGANDSFVVGFNTTASGSTSLVYGTYLGANGTLNSERGYDIIVDNNSYVCIVGSTNKTGFPVTAGAYQTGLAGAGDGFFSCFNPTAKTASAQLVYSTYLGGSGNEQAYSLALNSANGDINIGGYTSSSNFPTSFGAHQTNLLGSSDGFIVRFSYSSSTYNMAYSTLLGGSGEDVINDIGADTSGNVYVTGWTSSADYPTNGSANSAYNSVYRGGGSDAFVSKLNFGGIGSFKLRYSTLLGGERADTSYGLAVKGVNDVYVVGYTASADYPISTGVYKSTINDVDDAFITRLNTGVSGSSSLSYSTFLGGSGLEIIYSVAVDAVGNTYLTGNTGSPDFPTTLGVYSTAIAGSTDVFVTKLNPTGDTLLYSTYIGGKRDDVGKAITIGTYGSQPVAIVYGSTESSDYPFTSGAYDTSLNGVDDLFLTRLASDGGSLSYSTYIGGSGLEAAARNIALDANGDVYMTGRTSSSNFPLSPYAYATSLIGSVDAFLVRFEMTTSGTALKYSSYLGGTETKNDGDIGRAVAVRSSTQVYVAGYTSSNNFPVLRYNTAYDSSYADYGAGTENAGDGFVARFNTDATLSANSLDYATYLGGTGYDDIRAMVVDPNSSQVYVAGDTSSTNFPMASGYQITHTSGVTDNRDIFVARLNALAGVSGLYYSTYLGSSGNDVAYTLGFDASSSVSPPTQIYVAGNTDSVGVGQTALPSTLGAYQSSSGGKGDSFMAKLDASKTGAASLLYSSYLGGSRLEDARTMAVDASGSVYVAGSTQSLDFPTTSSALQTLSGGGQDAFVTKFSFSRLEFTTQPGNATGAGSNLSTQPVVRIVNPDTTTNTSFSGQVSLTLRSGSGTSGATLGGTTTLTFVSGVATYTGLSVSLAGTGYVLVAASGLLDTVESNPFDVSASSTAPAQLVLVSGSGQSTAINTAFGNPLVARLLKSDGTPYTGAAVNVTFQAPASSNASVGFGSSVGGQSQTVASNASGFVTSSLLYANNLIGTYAITATAVGVPNQISYVLSNLVTDTNNLNGLSLKLTPALSGPNPFSSTIYMTASLLRHGVTPVTNTTVYFTVTSETSGVSQVVNSAVTNNNGQAIISYTRVVSSDDLVLATTNLQGNLVSSNIANVYWLAGTKNVTIGPVMANFYQGDSCIFNKTLASPILWSQTFSDLQFDGSFSGPSPITFTNHTYDVNGNFIRDVASQGNSYMPLANLENFQAVFTGTLVISQSGTYPFMFNMDDMYIFGIGANAAGNSPTTSFTFTSESVAATSFFNFPSMASVMRGHGGAGEASFNVTFDAPGVYPYELDFTQCDAAPSGAAIISTAIDGDGNIRPIGSIELSATAGTSANVGQVISLTATARDASGSLWTNKPIVLTIGGANEHLSGLYRTTDASGQAVFTYTGTLAGIDSVQALGWPRGAPTLSPKVLVTYTGISSNPTGGSIIACDTVERVSFIYSVTNGSVLSGVVPINVPTAYSPETPILEYWSVDAPEKVTNLTFQASYDFNHLLAYLDTTKLANGSYVIQTVYRNGSNAHCRATSILVSVVGENKPGRVAFDLTDLSVPVAGLPVVVGRSYDSLERNTIGDFGYGWRLSVSSPRLEVNQKGDATLTMLDGKRVNFYFNPIGTMFGFMIPNYTPEPGVYGKFEQDTCGIVFAAGTSYTCNLGSDYRTSIANYYYTDPYGRIYQISRASGKLVSLTDLNGNRLTFEPGGIKSQSKAGPLDTPLTSDYVVKYGRDALGRIQYITDTIGQTYIYTYSMGSANITGNLIAVQLPSSDPVAAPTIINYDYYSNTVGSYSFAHFFRAAYDPRGNRAVISDYYLNDVVSGDGLQGRLKTVTDSLGYATSYSYTLPTTGGANATNTTRVTNPDGGVVTSTFNSYGKVLTETNPLGNSSYYKYDAKNQTQIMTNAKGYTTTYTYNDAGHQTQVYDALGNHSDTDYNPYGGPSRLVNQLVQATGVSYDQNFMPTIVTDSIGNVGGYEFDEKGSTLTRNDANGIPTRFTYDPYGNKQTETDAFGKVTRYGYDLLGRMTIMTDAKGYATRYRYDTLGRTISTTNALNQTMLMYYDANGNKTKDRDALGRETLYEYDTANRLTRVTYADTTYVQYGYDWRGTKITDTDQLSRVTTYTYDKAGQLLKTVYAFGTSDAAQTLVGYDEIGRRITETNPHVSGASGVAYTRYEYDKVGRVTTMTGQISVMTSTMGYDAAGRKLTDTNALGKATTYTYDERGRLTKTTYPALAGSGTVLSSTQKYDLAGRVISKTDQAGASTTYDYDIMGRLLAVNIPINPNGGITMTTRYGYDERGSLITITDALNHITKFEYDALGRQYRKTWPNGNFEQTKFDEVGNPIEQRLADSKVNFMSYDLLNRLKTTTLYDGSTQVFTYTATGQRASAKDVRGGLTSYSYDNRDRPITIQQPNVNVTSTQKVAYLYNAASQRISMTTSVGSSGSVVNENTVYSYDNAMRLLSVRNGVHANTSGEYNTYGYNALGQTTELMMGNAAKISYTYDNLNRLTGLNQTNSGSTSTFGLYTYTLGAAGNRVGAIEVLRAANSSSFVTRTLSWTYDQAYRLRTENLAISGGSTTNTDYYYDKVGNRTSMVVGSITTNYDYNDLDQLQQLTTNGTPGEQYGYDGRGNLTQVRQSNGVISSIYDYDPLDKFITATIASGNSASFKYDVDGRRVHKTATNSGITTVVNYLWDQLSSYGDAIIESDASGTQGISYVLGEGELLSQKQTAGGSTTKYYLTDASMNVRSLVDSGGSSVSDRYDYLAFGNLQPSSIIANYNPYRFASQQYDGVTNLYSMRARYYSPTIGRFQSRDGWEINYDEPVELNRYGYVTNNPINAYDPSGNMYAQTLKPAQMASVSGSALRNLGFFVTGLVVATIGVVFLKAKAVEVYRAIREELKKSTDDFIKNFFRFVIVIAMPVMTDGSTPTFITINNYYTEGWGKAYKTIIKTVKSLGRLADSGDFDSAGTHAEILMINFLRLVSWAIKGNQIIPGGVSHSDGICRTCQQHDSVVSTGTGGREGAFAQYLINLDYLIYLKLYAAGLQ